MVCHQTTHLLHQTQVGMQHKQHHITWEGHSVCCIKQVLELLLRLTLLLMVLMVRVMDGMDGMMGLPLCPCS